ncbi:MAG: GGDEF domain-containing protein [Lachnospiraceae bacterium]|nr:GGDEF domain-containing protein [Lachnospiraceae bacterium]
MGAQETDTETEQKTRLRHVYTFAVIIVAVTAILFITMFLVTVRRLQYVYTNQTYQNAVMLKKESVTKTVENLMAEIEQMRNLRLVDHTALIKGLRSAVQHETEEALQLATDADKASLLRSIFADDSSRSQLTGVAYDRSTGKILLDDRGLAGEAGVWTDDLADTFAVREEVTAGGITVVYGITETAFDQDMLSIMKDRPIAISGTEGTKYWIDRLTALDNGQISTVRVADPENPLREGMSLKGGGTGNGPETFATEGLLEALPGKPVFHSDNAEWEEDGRLIVTPTYTCAEYYEPYSWAVCAAFRLDRVGIDAVQLQEESRKETMRLGIRLAVSFAIVLAIAILLILRSSARYFNIRQKKLRDQVERDALTGANTRGYGTQLLETAFKRFNDRGDASPALMVLDVDKFKSINDSYGHDGGDEALKRVVKSAMKVGRGRDCVIRWGGDEFIAVFYRLEKARSESVANKLRKAIADTPIKHGGNTFQVTVSVGVTYFRFGDTSYQDALKRADEALYQSKELGRNRVCIAGEN